MTWLREHCPGCTKLLVESRFDATFRLPDGAEQLCFGVAAALCTACRQLYIAPAIIAQLDVRDARCVFAIESDSVQRERAATYAQGSTGG